MRASFCIPLLITVVLLSIFSPALAHPTAGASDYTKATKLLTEGKDFEQAIVLLQIAVQAQPKNADYHLALGCAYADRAASIGHAFEFQQMHAQYVEQYNDRVHILDKVRQQWGVGTYMKLALPEPARPPAFQPYTKDDGKPFRLTQDQVVQKLAALGSNAMQEWKEAVQLAGDANARAHAEYVQGYGLEMLSQYAKLKSSDDQSDADAPILPGYPTQDDAVAALRAAVKDAPKDAVYWESLGVGLNIIDLESKEAIADFRKSLALKPRKSILWNILYDSNDWKERATDTADLEHAQESDSDNAIPWYMVAYMYTERTPLIQDGMNSSDSPEILKAHPGFGRFDVRLYIDRQMAKTLTAEDGRNFHSAVVALETANCKPNFAWPRYQPPVPPMLLMAWRYSSHSIGESHLMSEIRELARATTGIVDVSAIEGHTALAMREAQDIVTMGKRITTYGEGLRGSNRSAYITYRMVGQSVEGIGYSAEACVATVTGDTVALKAAQAFLDRAGTQNTRLLGESLVDIQFDFPSWDY